MVQGDARDSKLLLFETFSLISLFTRASPRGARAPKKKIWGRSFMTSAFFWPPRQQMSEGGGQP